MIKSIYVIDDHPFNLREIAEKMNALPVKFIGFHYLAARKLPGMVDAKIGRIQYDTLLKQGKWLSDENLQKEWKRVNGH